MEVLRKRVRVKPKIEGTGLIPGTVIISDEGEVLKTKVRSVTKKKIKLKKIKLSKPLFQQKPMYLFKKSPLKILKPWE